MTKQEEYRSCMSTHLKGKTGLSKEERTLQFCISSRICSGKASNEEEARRLCAEAAAQPKPVKVKSTKRSKALDPHTTAVCVVERLSGQTATIESLAGALAQCTGQKAKKPRSFIETCIRENIVTGDLREVSALRTKCKAEAKRLRQEAS